MQTWADTFKGRKMCKRKYMREGQPWRHNLHALSSFQSIFLLFQFHKKKYSGGRWAVVGQGGEDLRTGGGSLDPVRP